MNFQWISSLCRRAWRSAIAFAVLGTGVRVGANLILIPLVLCYLSKEEQALWWVFIALGNFANLADFGFGQVISRVYSYLWAGAEDFDAEGLRPPPQHSEPNLPRIRQLNATVQYLYRRVSLGAMALLAVIGSGFLLRPIESAGHPARMWGLWGAYLLVVGFNLITSHWLLGAQGTNRVREMHLAGLWSSLLYLACAAVLLVSGQGLLSMVLATGLRGLVMRAVARKAYHKSVPALAGPPAHADLTILNRLWPNARKFGVLSIGGYFQSNAGVLISSAFLSTELTASVGLTNQVGVFIINCANLWLGVKWPEITMLRTRGALQSMARLFARRLALTLGTFLILALATLLFGNTILGWKGTVTRLLPSPYLLIYFLYLGHQVLYTNFGMLAFTENVVPFFRLGLFTGLFTLGLSLILTPAFSLWGLLLAPILSEGGCSGWFVVRRGFQGQPLSVTEFLREAIQGRV